MQVVLITGGSSGIGKATGELLQSNGYAVIGTSRSPDYYTDHPFPLIQMDLHDATSIQKAVETVVTKYGTIDVLVNNACIVDKYVYGTVFCNHGFNCFLYRCGIMQVHLNQRKRMICIVVWRTAGSNNGIAVGL